MSPSSSMNAPDVKGFSTVTPDAARASGSTLSIKVKGLIVFAALLIYAVAIGVFIFHQKNLLLHDFEEIQSALETEALMQQADAVTFHAIMAMFVTMEEPNQDKGMPQIQMLHQSLRGTHGAITARLPRAQLRLAPLDSAWIEAENDASKSNLNRLSLELIKFKSSLAVLTNEVREARQVMSVRYRAKSDAVALTSVLLGLLGLGLLGLNIGLFFRRLTIDLRMLQDRALSIVRGFRGKPIEITRDDEVGHLMGAVNNMAHILDARENELLLERQKYFHHEKMAAIGVLAAGISHEIGNPIAAIAGVAQEMIDCRDWEKGQDKKIERCGGCQPDLIYSQTVRLAAITREISEFASPRAAEPQLLDLNAQLRSSTSLIRYDKRLDRVDLQLDLDSQLPAIHGVADQLTQVIMNLLINAMDALEGIEDRPRTIVVSTGSDEQQVWILISDNGCGISQVSLNRVFEAFFTTKPAGKGTGLGLSLCYSIVRANGGTIEIESELGVGTQVNVFFPLNPSPQNETDHP
jgi:two-component system NtrC family sensor kinase